MFRMPVYPFEHPYATLLESVLKDRLVIEIPYALKLNVKTYLFSNGVALDKGPW